MAKKRVYVESSVMDPLEEIRAIREKISGEFKTIRELGEYLRKEYSGTDLTSGTSGARRQAVFKSIRPQTSKTAKGQQMASKRLSHT